MMEADGSLYGQIDAEGVEGNGGSSDATVKWCRHFVQRELGETGRVDPTSAWKIIYKAIMWTEEAHDAGRTAVIPHIIDKDRLLADGGKPKRARTIEKAQPGEAEVGGGWYSKATLVGQRLVSEFGLTSTDDLRHTMGQVYSGRKREQNTTSAAFETIVGDLVNRHLQFASGQPGPYCEKPRWTDLRDHLRGYRFATKNEVPKPDLLIPLNDPMAILSLKWSMRDDHISQMIGEAVKVHSVRPDITIFAVTNEFDLRRLLSVAEDPQIHRVYHVNMALLNEAHRPREFNTDLIESRQDVDTVRYVLANHKLRDLSELFEDMLWVLSPDERDRWTARKKEEERTARKSARKQPR